MRRMRNSVHLGERPRRKSFSSTGTLRYYRSKGRKWTQSRNHQTSRLQHQFGRWMHLWPKKLIRRQRLRLPQLSHFRAPPCRLILLPNLGTWHPLSQKLMRRMSLAGSFLRKSAFQSRNYWLWLQRSGGISRKQPPRRGYQLCQQRHTSQQPITLPLSQWKSTTNIFQLNQHCHFGRLRLLWITQLRSQASSTVAARSSLSARTYGKDWECQ